MQARYHIRNVNISMLVILLHINLYMLVTVDIYFPTTLMTKMNHFTMCNAI